MATELAAGVDPVQPETVLPGETIATDTASLPNSDEPATAEPEAGAEEAAAEPEAAAAAAEPAADPGKKPDKPPLTWQEKRRIEETNKRRAAEARNAELEAELQRLREAAAKPAEGGSAATQPASAPLSQEQAIAAARAGLERDARAREFTEATGRVLAAGLKEIPDFEQARQEMVGYFGDQLNARPDFFEAITSLDNGHQVFYDLAKNPEETERLLQLSPAKLGVEIAKLGTKKAAPAPAPISKAPAPIRPVGGSAQPSTRLDDPNLPMDDFAKTFLKQVAGRGR